MPGKALQDRLIRRPLPGQRTVGVVAQAAAFIILDGLGVEATTPSAAYVAHWAAGDAKKVTAMLGRITKIAAEIEGELLGSEAAALVS